MDRGKSSKPSAGSDIEAICGKCGDTWHVVVAMVGSEVARVQCKECKGLHKYRPLGGKPKRERPAARGTTASRPRAKAAPPEPEGPAVEADLTRPVRPYRVFEHYEVGERVDHLTFGTGVVEESDPGKITVYFRGGRKRLAQAAPAPKLERPPRLPVE